MLFIDFVEKEELKVAFIDNVSRSVKKAGNLILNQRFFTYIQNFILGRFKENATRVPNIENQLSIYQD